jgi:hypothetical protein
MSGPQKVDRPDETGPEFSDYDLTNGKCSDTGKFRYRTWLRVVDCERLKFIGIERFTNARNGRPIRQVHGHTPFYAYPPDDVTMLHGE